MDALLILILAALVGLIGWHKDASINNGKRGSRVSKKRK